MAEVVGRRAAGRDGGRGEEQLAWSEQLPEQVASRWRADPARSRIWRLGERTTEEQMAARPAAGVLWAAGTAVKPPYPT